MTEFFRLSGGGNDFLALAEPRRAPTPEEVRAWCARGLSLGADGLFVLRRTPAGVDMEHFNPDGRPAALCINGTRCAARLAFELEWARDELVVETGAGPVPARRSAASEIALTLPAPVAPAEQLACVSRAAQSTVGTSSSACRTSWSSGRAPWPVPR